MSDWIQNVLLKWRSEGVKLNPPASIAEIENVESRLILSKSEGVGKPDAHGLLLYSIFVSVSLKYAAGFALMACLPAVKVRRRD